MKVGIVVWALMLASPALAQSPPVSVADSGFAEQGERLQQVRLMERALEDAVTRGVRIVEQQLPPVPGVLYFAGLVRVRGFELEDYGVFFDVEHPVVRRSIIWSMHTLHLNGGMPTIFQDLQRRLQTMPEGMGQLAFEQILSEMEADLQRTAPRTAPLTLGGPGAARVSSGEDADTRRSDRPVTVDPLEAYLTALRGELTDALISYGPALSVAEGHWVSVGARDGRGQIDQRLSSPSQTLKLRIRGRDLAALRAGRLSVDDLRRRVEAP